MAKNARASSMDKEKSMSTDGMVHAWGGSQFQGGPRLFGLSLEMCGEPSRSP